MYLVTADSPILRESRLSAHVVDVELEVAAGHDGEDEAQAVFGLERVRQVHHEPANAHTDRDASV